MTKSIEKNGQFIYCLPNPLRRTSDFYQTVGYIPTGVRGDGRWSWCMIGGEYRWDGPSDLRPDGHMAWLKNSGIIKEIEA